MTVPLAMVLALSCTGAVCAAQTAHSAGASFGIEKDTLTITTAERSLRVSLECPAFVFGSLCVGGAKPIEIRGSLSRSRQLQVSYQPQTTPGGARLEALLHLQWSPKEQVLRKYARYRVTGGSPGVLSEVVLERLSAKGVVFEPQPPQSYPVFLDGFFAGVEFPVASTRVEDGRVLLAHKPGLSPRPGVWYETKKAVYGLASPGNERRTFQRYVADHRPTPHGMHFNYNSWWTSPVPYTEADILGLMQTFDEKLYRPHGVAFDTFCIDMGWSERERVWRIDPKLFPDGFTKIRDAAQRMHSHLGLWISPSNCYSPSSFDNELAQKAGYETFTTANGRYACLAGERYRDALRDCLVEMVTKWGVRHVKFDGYVPTCPEASHGHAPGELSAEAVAEGIIDVFQAVRRAAPGTWMETTCMGWNPSPWWLFHVNSVIGTFGDDAPYGRVPSPVYRESYTTARDYFNLQGAYWLAVPPVAQEVLGIVHQTGEPFLNDAVMCVMRGHAFLPAYINPRDMDDRRWRALAALMKWARANAARLADTEPLLPRSWTQRQITDHKSQIANPPVPRFTNSATMPREPYGYAHWRKDGGLIALRNPWIEPQSYPLKIEAQGSGLAVISLYPEQRVYGAGLKSGSTLNVPLAPYETLVLGISREGPPKDVPDVAVTPPRRMRAEVTAREVSRVEFEGSEGAFGPDWTSLVGDAKSGVEVAVEGSVTVDAPCAELPVLVEGEQPPSQPMGVIRVNGAEVQPAISSSETGWGASGMSRPEHWVFMRAPLKTGVNTVALDLVTDGRSTISAWVWATKPGDTAVADGLLPQPEVISLDAVALLEPLDTSRVAGEVSRKPRPVERIEGVFLDTLEPSSVAQGWGALQRNLSVWEKPLTIAGRSFVRGLGTHAPSRIVYALDGRYRRFQCWVGADGATAPTITFQVLVDGKTVFDSGLITREDPAKRVDVDVTGVKTLELVVGDGGNGLMSDHADWADARLVR